MLTHKPFNKCCPVCVAAKARRRPHVRKVVPTYMNMTTFGEVVTGDHMVVQPTPQERTLLRVLQPVGVDHGANAVGEAASVHVVGAGGLANGVWGHTATAAGTRAT